MGGGLQRRPAEVLQINVGKLCNQTCVHCHVDAGPHRVEQMGSSTADSCIALIDRLDTIQTVDITGGAPELNGEFRRLVSAARSRSLEVIDRCNLTVLQEPGQEDLADFLAENQVWVIASLPCYLEENVDGQRGKGVFQRSIEALQQLNSLGYGSDGVHRLDLVYNPTGPMLPPEASGLERTFKKQLASNYGVTFDTLITITNMVINRFESFLRRSGELESYQQLLEENFNPATIPNLMCLNTLSISWDGFIYDCDFNQMLDLKLGREEPLRVEDLTAEAFLDLEVITGRHCFGCTAGTGSSCGGALV
ncbi:MAG TPA: radical SAM/Cys-rich domain protein [Planctomycetes bacterium]|nr:radical SAM/Cys-rich domain protein [Planctomycetota bacterium]HIN79716.1 radical SAM/Cys-rich domain protein [Planctomycetota bacterium]